LFTKPFPHICAEAEGKMSIRNNLIAIKSLMLYYMYMSFQKQENNKADEYHMTTSQKKKRQYIFLPQGK